MIGQVADVRQHFASAGKEQQTQRVAVAVPAAPIAAVAVELRSPPPAAKPDAAQAASRVAAVQGGAAAAPGAADRLRSHQSEQRASPRPAQAVTHCGEAAGAVHRQSALIAERYVGERRHVPLTVHARLVARQPERRQVARRRRHGHVRPGRCDLPEEDRHLELHVGVVQRRTGADRRGGVSVRLQRLAIEALVQISPAAQQLGHHPHLLHERFVPVQRRLLPASVSGELSLQDGLELLDALLDLLVQSVEHADAHPRRGTGSCLVVDAAAQRLHVEIHLQQQRPLDVPACRLVERVVNQFVGAKQRQEQLSVARLLAGQPRGAPFAARQRRGRRPGRFPPRNPPAGDGTVIGKPAGAAPKNRRQHVDRFAGPAGVRVHVLLHVAIQRIPRVYVGKPVQDGSRHVRKPVVAGQCGRHGEGFHLSEHPGDARAPQLASERYVRGRAAETAGMLTVPPVPVQLFGTEIERIGQAQPWQHDPSVLWIRGIGKPGAAVRTGDDLGIEHAPSPPWPMDRAVAARRRSMPDRSCRPRSTVPDRR